MENKALIPPPKSLSRSFTLIEIIIVIIIVGVLAALGMIEYRQMTERGRGVEARTVMGDMRKFAYQYWLENGTLTGITNADVNLGAASAQFPPGCRSSHYFQYGGVSETTSTTFRSIAWRCTSGGKSPQGSLSDSTMCSGCRVLQLDSNFETGTDVWTTWGVY